MEFISLNIGALNPEIPTATAKAPATGEQVDIAELGASGTPVFGGFLRELGEYNPELTGLSAVRTYERMRRSDGQVWATLAAIKHPIRGAEWKVQEPKDANRAENAAADLVKSCLFDELNLDDVISNALLQIDFGFAAHENVWYIDRDTVRLKKCAPRLPITAYRWITNDSGDELVALEQMGYRGGNYIVTQIPAEKLCVFTHQQEGGNFTGISLLRAMYQHWYVKAGLYKVEAIACERNGMGVPWITTAAGAKKEDLADAKTWLQSLAVNESTSLLLPPGWSFGIEGVKGTIQSPKDAIAHHNSMITKVGLAQFMDLGGPDRGGNRALGETMSDFFYLSLQAVANSIARQIDLKVIKPLCDYNFQGIRYPKLVPQNIFSTNFETAANALKDLASSSVGVIRPDDDLEAWVRMKLGAPKATKRIAVSGKAGVKVLASAGFAPSAKTPAPAPVFSVRQQFGIRPIWTDSGKLMLGINVPEKSA
jgi:phage gp29-like protein